MNAITKKLKALKLDRLPSTHYLAKRAAQDPDDVSFFAVGGAHYENCELLAIECAIIIVKGGKATKLVYDSLVRSGLLQPDKTIPV